MTDVEKQKNIMDLKSEIKPDKREIIHQQNLLKIDKVFEVNKNQFVCYGNSATILKKLLKLFSLNIVRHYLKNNTFLAWSFWKFHFILGFALKSNEILS